MPRKKLLKKLFAGSLAIMLGLCELSYTPPHRLSENPQFLAILGTKNARFFGHYLSVYSYLTSKTE